MALTEVEAAEFSAEALELLEIAEKSLLEMDAGAELGAHYDVIFRTLHNLKGTAGTWELTKLESHMHQLETIFVATKGQKRLSKELVDFLLRGIDATKSILSGDTVEFEYTISKETSTPPVVNLRPVPVSIAKPVMSSLPASPALLRVLVLGDETKISNELKQALKQTGFMLESAPPGLSAKDLLAFHRPHSVISIGGVEPSLIAEFDSSDSGLSVLHYIENTDAALFAQICAAQAQVTQLRSLVDRSIDLLMYQHSDLHLFLKKSGKQVVLDHHNTTLMKLIDDRRNLDSKKTGAA